MLKGDSVFQQIEHANAVVQPAQLTLPSERLIIDGPPRSYHYWAGVIQGTFIPFMVANGKHKFSSSELYSWIGNGTNVQMTTGDIEPRTDGKEHWRKIVTSSLALLKDQGLIKADKGGKVYLILNQPCGELRSLEREQ